MRKVAILGGGTAGWMAANLLSTLLPSDKVQVSLIESPDIGIIGVGEGSTPTLKRFFNLCGIAESEWMPVCNATYKVNIRFAGWSPLSGIESYSHPFISQVDNFTERAFEVNCRTRRLGLNTNTKPEDFLLNGVLAQQQKGPITPDSFPFRMEYGYHFDSYLLGAFLRDKAKSKGVSHIEGEVVDVECHNNGDIATLKLKDGHSIDADFFIDCTGFAAVLIQKTLNVPFQSFANNLFNNAAVVLPTLAQVTPAVETRATALSNGWFWQIPLQNRTGNGYVYSDSFTTPEDAETELRATLSVSDDVEARHLKMRVGQLQQHWAHNCLGLGLAQGFIEPLEATALHLVQVCIEMFIDKWQSGNFTTQNRDSFNQQMNQRFEHVRDYIVAHYKLNTRNDSEYWRANRENNQFSDSLGHILNAWFTKQDLKQEIERQQLESHFGSVSWHCLLSGYGAYPSLAPQQPGKGDLYVEKGVEKFLYGCALNFQSHNQNLQQLTHK